MDAVGPGAGADLWTVEPYQVANEARQRLVTIRARLAELEARRVQLATLTTSAVTIAQLQSVERARRAAKVAVMRAAEAKRRVRKLYLHSARVHDYAANSYEVGATASPLHADHYRQRAAWHRQAAQQDRLNAECISSPGEPPDALAAVGGRSRGRDRQPDDSEPASQLLITATMTADTYEAWGKT